MTQQRPTPKIAAALLAAMISTFAAAEEPATGDWGLNCSTVAPPKKPTCTMFQNLLREDRKRILSFTIHFPEPSDRPVGVLTLPLGLYLPRGIELSIDSGEIRKFPIETCTAEGCRTALLLGDALVNEMRRGNKGLIRFYSGNQQPIELPLSLTGFSRAFKAIQPDA